MSRHNWKPAPEGWTALVLSHMGPAAGGNVFVTRAARGWTARLVKDNREIRSDGIHPTRDSAANNTLLTARRGMKP